jgi:heme/copper-type cytochrome/quinol oxidase subunit 2
MSTALSPLFYTALFWLAALCAVVASLAVVWSVRPRRHAETATPGTHSHSIGDLVWAVLPAVALFVILALTWRHVP